MVFFEDGNTVATHGAPRKYLQPTEKTRKTKVELIRPSEHHPAKENLDLVPYSSCFIEPGGTEGAAILLHCFTADVNCSDNCLWVGWRKSGREIRQNFGWNFLGVFVLHLPATKFSQKFSHFTTPCPVAETSNFISASFWGLGAPNLCRFSTALL